jgi:2-hydroxychromene-2-carboxylate isomerase
MTERRLRFYFHPRSPYARIGLHLLRRMRAAERVPTEVRIFFRSADGNLPDPTGTRARKIYVMQDAPRAAARAGLSIAMPPTLDTDWSPFYGAFYAARREDRALEVATALADARWGEGRDIGDRAVVADVVRALGVTLDPLGAEACKPLMQEDQAHVDRDLVFGVPFAVLDTDGKKERFFGQDRMAELDDAIG